MERGEKVAVLMGGWSREREVSLRSGKKVLAALNAQGYEAFGLDPAEQFQALLTLSPETVDKVFIALHGQFGEDGKIQSLLELLGLPYTGSRVTASALAMHKVRAKQIFCWAQVPTPGFMSVQPYPVYEAQAEHMLTKLGLPLVVKPASEGSSVGVQIVEEREKLPLVLAETVALFQEVFVEQYVPGQEVTVGILEKDGNPMVLPILELVPHKGFYDYEAKYTKGLTDFILPARLTASQTALVEQAALSAHHALGCRGVSRVDLMVDRSGQPYVIEVNTIPGLTDLSDLPAQAAHIGIAYPELIEIILASAV